MSPYTVLSFKETRVHTVRQDAWIRNICNYSLPYSSVNVEKSVEKMNEKSQKLLDIFSKKFDKRTEMEL